MESVLYQWIKMLFSSTIFLYLFLPLTLLGYYLSGRHVRNYWLLLASLIFFAWGGVSFTGILIGSIVVNFVFGLQIQRTLERRASYQWLFAGVAINLLILGVFKYANFLIENLNLVLDTVSIPLIPQSKIVLPVGISFYTFHSLSYLVDIYRRKTVAQRNIFDLSLYITMFSQLIAGPIIRYSDMWQQLRERTHTWAKFSSGVERFLIGLGKKVLLANTFARVADTIFTTDTQSLGAANAWLGILCYSLQIYCDFAGYSDMAIGLGRMFGFEFLENFNYPYIAKSVKDFWRRWHISLSTFFRDYVYIPLGGNRATVARTYVNLLLVFFLTGFWHGASWSFVVWGLLHGFFMVIERLGFEKVLAKTWSPVANLYTILVVMFAWVLFRADSLEYAVEYWGAMVQFSSSPAQTALFWGQIGLDLKLALLIAFPGVFGIYNWLWKWVEPILRSPGPLANGISYFYHVGSAAFYGAILLISTIYLIAGTYNPFIYYRF
jgi:alginate O-acetyltransferase complex protein AlgI